MPSKVPIIGVGPARSTEEPASAAHHETEPNHLPGGEPVVVLYTPAHWTHQQREVYAGRVLRVVARHELPRHPLSVLHHDTAAAHHEMMQQHHEQAQHHETGHEEHHTEASTEHHEQQHHESGEHEEHHEQHHDEHDSEHHE